jgi:hypothetical protein
MPSLFRLFSPLTIFQTGLLGSRDPLIIHLRSQYTTGPLLETRLHPPDTAILPSNTHNQLVNKKDGKDGILARTIHQQRHDGRRARQVLCDLCSAVQPTNTSTGKRKRYSSTMHTNTNPHTGYCYFTRTPRLVHPGFITCSISVCGVCMVFESDRTEEQRFPCIRRLVPTSYLVLLLSQHIIPTIPSCSWRSNSLSINILCCFLWWLLSLTCFNA